MGDKILNEMAKILRVDEKDIPKTLIRFKADIRNMKKELSSIKKL